MKTRLDFVSNSSSTSFIIHGDNDIAECNKHFSNIGYYKVNNLRIQNIILRDSINAAIKNYCTALELDEQWCANDTHLNGQIICNLKNEIENINDFIKQIDDVFGKDIDNNTYITSPIDRDDAYQIGFYKPAWDTDL